MIPETECLRLFQIELESVSIATENTSTDTRLHVGIVHFPTQITLPGQEVSMQADGELTDWFGTQGRVVAAAEMCLTKLGSADEPAFCMWELPCSELEIGMC